MRSGSSSTARPVGCGCRRRSRTPFCCTTRPGRASATLEPSASGTGSSSTAVKCTGSTPTDTFFAFLKKLRRFSSGAGRRVVVILDNVRYHHAGLHRTWRDKCRKSFTLLFMPPYIPELNPIERVWKLTRRMATHNRYFPTLDSFPVAVESVFDPWRTGNATLKRLCAL